MIGSIAGVAIRPLRFISAELDSQAVRYFVFATIIIYVLVPIIAFLMMH